MSPTPLPSDAQAPARAARAGGASACTRRAALARAGIGLFGMLARDARAIEPAPGEVPIGQVLPDGVLAGLNGPTRQLSDFRGRALIINVWASWCGPCRQEMSSLERLAWRGDRGVFDIIGISTDDDMDAARRFLQASHATLTHFIDHRLFWETRLGASHLPLTTLVDAHGRVLERVVGAREWDGAEAAAIIARCFGAPRSATKR